MSKVYYYGMRLRPYGPGCQPKGAIGVADDPSGKYWNIICYDKQLTEELAEAYDLEQIIIHDEWAKSPNHVALDIDWSNI